MGKIKDISGQTFGRLTARYPYGINSQRHATWYCVCSCGREGVFSGPSLRSGNTKSCGCASHELLETRNHKHGQCKRGERASENAIWSAMKQRCSNPNNRDYRLYGGRGISVCDRWLESFDNFMADMGNRPSPAHSIDRIDNDGNYEPSNCRWATKSVQNRNTRRIRPVLRSDGKRFHSLAEAAEHMKGDRSNICAALNGRLPTAYGFSWAYENTSGLVL